MSKKIADIVLTVTRQKYVKPVSDYYKSYHTCKSVIKVGDCVWGRDEKNSNTLVEGVVVYHDPHCEQGLIYGIARYCDLPYDRSKHKLCWIATAYLDNYSKDARAYHQKKK